MPVIKIREKTEEITRPVSAQSNAAVIPLFVMGLYSVKTDDNEKPVWERKEFTTKLYKSVTAFETDYSSWVIRDSGYDAIDNSYMMIYDLLDNGLEVYVDPIDLTSPQILPGEEKSVTIIVDPEDESQNVTITGNTLNSLFEDVFKFYYLDENQNKIYYDVVIPSTQGMTEADRVNLESIIKEDIRTGKDYTGTPASWNIPVDLRPEIDSEIDEKTFSKILNKLISVDDFTDLSRSYYFKFTDKTRFNFKFLTTGAHANAYFDDLLDNGEVVGLNINTIQGPFRTMICLCASLDEVDKYSGRGDCLTLVDFEGWLRKDSKVATIYDAMVANGYDIEFNYKNYNEYYKFASCTYPWIIREVSNDGDKKLIEYPGSFGYLKAFANSISPIKGQGNPDYYSIAGYRRGYVGTDDIFTPVERLGEIDLHIFQSDSMAAAVKDPNKDPETAEIYKDFNITINPIVRFQENNIGVYRIWGNRVLLPAPLNEDGIPDADNVQDVNYFLNVRQLVCDVKKQCYFASMRVSFEPNDDVTWFNYKTFVNPMLESMVSNRGLDWYTWNRLESDIKGQMKAKLTIKPIEAVESFDITVYIRNTDEE